MWESESELESLFYRLHQKCIARKLAERISTHGIDVFEVVQVSGCLCGFHRPGSANTTAAKGRSEMNSSFILLGTQRPCSNGEELNSVGRSVDICKGFSCLPLTPRPYSSSLAWLGLQRCIADPGRA